MKTKNTLLLLVRLIAGGLIAYAGYTKVIDMEETVSNLSKGFGLSTPIIWAVAWGELLSGLGLIFGVWARLSAVGAAIIMCGVFYYTRNMDMGVSKYMIEAATILLGSAIILITGAGSWALTGRKGSSAATVAQSVNPVPPSTNPQM